MSYLWKNEPLLYVNNFGIKTQEHDMVIILASSTRHKNNIAIVLTSRHISNIAIASTSMHKDIIAII